MGEVEQFRQSPTGEKAEQMAMDISNKISETKNKLETEVKEEKKLVNFEANEGQDLETLVEEQDMAEKEVGEEFVITEKAEKSAQQRKDKGLHNAESQIHQMESEEIAELAEMDKQAAENLKHTAQNVLHAEKEAEQTKSQLESLKNISGQFMTTLEEANIGNDVAEQAMKQTSDVVEGLNNLMTEVNALAQEAAQAGQEIAKAGQEAGVAAQDAMKAAQTGAQAGDKVLGTVKNTASVAESLTGAISNVAERIETESQKINKN